MTDKLALSAIAAASGAASYGWLATANGIATFIVTLLTGVGSVLAALYYYERYRKLRKQRKENK